MRGFFIAIGACIIVAFLVLGFVIGLLLGRPDAIIRNADIELRSGAELAHIHLINCNVTASASALEVNLHDNKFTDNRELKAASK